MKRKPLGIIAKAEKRMRLRERAKMGGPEGRVARHLLALEMGRGGRPI